MLSTEMFLVLYYLGFGFVIFLIYLAVADTPGAGRVPRRNKRLRRLAVGLAVAGLVHPGFALAGRDLVIQMGEADGLPDPGTRQVIRLTTWGLALALALVGLVVLSALGALGGVPLLRHLGDGLPYA